MASVTVADPFALRSLRQRIFASRRSMAIAASLALALVGSMAASVAWTLANQDVLLSVGNWVLAQGTQAGWLAAPRTGLQLHRAAVVRERAGPRGHPRAGCPWRSAWRSLAYLSGVFALRRLLALPTQQVAHAG